jgi:hypothetical protein
VRKKRYVITFKKREEAMGTLTKASDELLNLAEALV